MIAASDFWGDRRRIEPPSDAETGQRQQIEQLAALLLSLHREAIGLRLLVEHCHTEDQQLQARSYHLVASTTMACRAAAALIRGNLSD